MLLIIIHFNVYYKEMYINSLDIIFLLVDYYKESALYCDRNSWHRYTDIGKLDRRWENGKEDKSGNFHQINYHRLLKIIRLECHILFRNIYNHSQTYIH